MSTVFTPIFFKLPERPLDTTPPKPGQEDYDFAAIHRNVEFYEVKINDGETTDYCHPACAVRMYDENQPMEMNSEDEERYMRYVDAENENIKPTFWPPRPWDLEVRILSQEESDSLAKRIRAKEEEGERAIASALQTKTIPEISPEDLEDENKDNETIEVKIAGAQCNTDCSDGCTEWCEF